MGDWQLMATKHAQVLRAYAVKITAADGSAVVFPGKLLTQENADSLPEHLHRMAREAGFPLHKVDLEPVTVDDRDRLLAEAQSFFAQPVAPKPLHAVNIGIQCTSCKTVVPLHEALDEAHPVADFLSGDPLAGDSRCEQCSRHSIENCYDCRTDWLISGDRNFQFVCASCREQRV